MTKQSNFNINLNLPQLFAEVFGYRAGLATLGVMDQAFNQYKGVEALEKSPGNAYSYMGTPVWDYIELEPTTISGTGEHFEGYRFPLECVVEALRPKNIVETDIVGKDGEVEELMSLSNWQLSIKGFIVNYESQDYPEIEVQELQRICELKDTELPVEGTFLTLLGIDFISIHRLNLVASPGYSNMQAFEIEARGKKPFKLDAYNGI